LHGCAKAEIIRRLNGLDLDEDMTLRLWIENVDRLPDGGPLRVEVKGRGLDVGRDTHLDWTLPDPSRTVSSKHCEIRFRDGGYWLHDVSTNGTYVNGAQYRLDAPYLLRGGDRVSIGPYIIAVDVEGQTAAQPETGADGGVPAAAGRDLWGEIGEAAAPDDRSAYQVASRRETPPDFLDFASSIAPAELSPTGAPAPDDWLNPASPPPAVPPRLTQPPQLQPRRPAAAQDPIPEAQPPRHPTVPPAPAASPADSDGAEFLRRIARAAGLPEESVSGRDPGALADEIGVALRLTAENLQRLLTSRAESKTLMRSSSRTMIRSMNNNPLKFTGTVEEALAILIGPPTRQYLDLQATIEESFRDLKTHQLLTYGAMQGALDALFDDLAPDQIDRSIPPERGLGSLVVPRKAKLWDTYIERWRAKTRRSDGRLFEAFIALFAEAYDRLQNKG
jgi:type VI secretion system protein ImpI